MGINLLVKFYLFLVFTGYWFLDSALLLSVITIIVGGQKVCYVEVMVKNFQEMLWNAFLCSEL